MPTLVEPNPYCHEELAKFPLERHVVAASNTTGRAELFMTKEWLTSTGTSLYRENTPHFRDEAMIKLEVDKVRLDDLFEGRRFDFVKIDTEGSNWTFSRAERRYCARPTTSSSKYPSSNTISRCSRGSHLFPIESKMGFHCVDVTEFHRPEADGPLVQLDFLFEKTVRRPRPETSATRRCSITNRFSIICVPSRRNAPNIR